MNSSVGPLSSGKRVLEAHSGSKEGCVPGEPPHSVSPRDGDREEEPPESED